MVATASTREAYGETLLALGREDPNIVVVGGDLNVSTFTHLFAKEFPHRFFDLGPAEQNMMSMAAGLAATGKTVFASTFAVFGTGRPFDQLRISIAQQIRDGIARSYLNVKIVVTHAGIITGEDGISAHSVEDLSLMCALPGFSVVVPADGPETALAVRAAAATPGPFYIRLSRPATPVVHQGQCHFALGKAEAMRPGTDATIIACGFMVGQALEAAATLERRGLNARVLNMPTLAPIDEDAIVAAAEETGAVVTAEEHLRHGGLGSIVARVLGEHRPVPLKLVALEGYAESGKPEQLLERYGLAPSHIVEAVESVVGRKVNTYGYYAKPGP